MCRLCPPWGRSEVTGSLAWKHALSLLLDSSRNVGVVCPQRPQALQWEPGESPDQATASQEPVSGPRSPAPRPSPVAPGEAVSTANKEAALSPSGLVPEIAPSSQARPGVASGRLLSHRLPGRVPLEALDGARPPDEAALAARPSPVISGSLSARSPGPPFPRLKNGADRPSLYKWGKGS